MNRAKGFSLIELMIVVAVIAILSTIVLPAYGDYVKRGKLVDGTAQLSDGRVKIEQFFQDNRTYVGADASPPCPASTKYFAITCENLTVSTYSIVATGQGTVSGFNYWINQANVKGSATPWGDGGTCWIMRKGDSC